MAELDYEFSKDCETLTWSWTGVPTDDSAPGRDNYFTSVTDDETGEVLGWFPGAEDNAWGIPYTVDVTPGHDVYMFVANEAWGFSYETDAVIHCHVEVPVETITDPFTSILMTTIMTIWGILHWIGRFIA